jgi:hypothetical protein
VPIGGPQFQLGIARRVQPYEQTVLVLPHLELRDDFSVAAVESFCESHERAEQLDDLSRLA